CARITELIVTGFWASRALMTAIELGLFTELDKGPRSARQLRESLGLGERGTPDFLDALVALNFLAREGDDEHAVYINTRDSADLVASFAAVLSAVNERARDAAIAYK